MNPVPAHVLQSHFFKVYFSIILPFTSRSSKWSLHQIFLLKFKIHFVLPHTCHMPHPSYYAWFYRSSLSSLLQSAVALSVSVSPPSTLLSSTLRPSSVQTSCTCSNSCFQHVGQRGTELSRYLVYNCQPEFKYFIKKSRNSRKSIELLRKDTDPRLQVPERLVVKIWFVSAVSSRSSGFRFRNFKVRKE
jgi:hypothetical protein